MNRFLRADMLSQLKTLTQETDGRYATDTELMFLQNYLKTARLRFSAYQKIQAAESRVVQQLTDKLMAMDPTLLQVNKVDQTGKCQRDAVYFLRYVAQALLIDDETSLQEHLLMWLQTMVKAFKHDRNTRTSYVILEDLLKQYLTPAEVELLVPILETARSLVVAA